MRNFKSWLENRDESLMETMSKEKMQMHDMDALKAAHDEKKQEDELEEKVRAVKYLAGIKKNIEKFVDAHNKGAKILKLIGAALLNKSHSKSGVQTSLRKIYNHHLKSLHDLQQVFKHDNLMKHMTDIDSLHALYLLLTSDMSEQISGLEDDPTHFKTDHEHGEIGKKFAKFVVDQIIHATEDQLENLLIHHDKADDVMPKEGDQEADMSNEPMGDDMSASTAGMGGKGMAPPAMGGDDMPLPTAGAGAPAPMGMAPPMGGDMAPPPPMGQMPAGSMKAGATGAAPPPMPMGDDAMGASPMGSPKPTGMGATSPQDDNALMPPVGMGASAQTKKPMPNQNQG